MTYLIMLEPGGDKRNIKRYDQNISLILQQYSLLTFIIEYYVSKNQSAAGNWRILP